MSLAIVVYLLYRILSRNNRDHEVLIAAAYITGIEVFMRMTGGNLSYDFTKYSVIIFLVIGMFYKGINRSSWPYLFFVVFLIPGILFSAINLDYETSMVKALAANLSGPVCLGVAALYCYDRKISSIRMQQILMAVLLPVITTAVYLYLYNPSIRDVLSGTESNFEASGGYGPNQVATILGLGIFILFSRLLLVKNKLVNAIDFALLGLISYRAIVTFSRGGVIAAIICAVIFLLVYLLYSDIRSKARSLPKIGIIVGVVFATWLYSSVSTMGLIEKRYANQDAAGRSKADLTTGRMELLSSELEAFYTYPITGIGVGKIKEYRLEQTGRESATHNEVSRVLSEHGLFGLAALSVLLLKPLILRYKNRSNLFLLSFVAFWFLTINHSSMRLAAPAFIYGLAVLTIIRENKKDRLHRKPLER